MWGPTTDRGQVNFDFAVGVSILAITIVVAFGFVPGLLGGVTEGRAQGDQVAADRVAAWLAEDGLGDGASPGRVDEDCVRALFDDSLDACDFDESSVEENVFVTDRSVNVTVTRDGARMCWEDGVGFAEEGSGGHPSDCSTAAGYTELSGDSAPGGSSDVAVASRAVNADGEQLEIVVRVW